MQVLLPVSLPLVDNLNFIVLSCFLQFILGFMHVFIFYVFIVVSMIIFLDTVTKALKLCNSTVVTLDPNQGIMDIISWIERIERRYTSMADWSRVEYTRQRGKGRPITKCYGTPRQVS